MSDEAREAGLSEAERGEVWRNKHHRGITVIVNEIMGDAVQVMNEEETHLRWLTRKGFFRDYEPAFETT